MMESFIIYQATDRRKMVALKLIDDILWITHFILIGGYTGALTNLFAIFREIVFYFKGKKKWATSPVWAFIFSAVFISCAPLSWAGIFSIFPVIGSVISTWVFWVNKTEVGKLMMIPVLICYLIYAVVYSSYSSIVSQLIILASIAVFFIKRSRQKDKSKTE